MEKAGPDIDALLGRERRRSRRALAVGAVVVLSVSGIAVGAWYGFAADQAPQPAAESPLATASVERRTLRDTFTVRGVARYQDLATLRAPGAGVVTDVAVGTGNVVKPGAVLYRIAGKPVIAIVGSFPFWRDLGPTAKGVDVKQLETFLKASGYNPGPVDETFTTGTEQAVKKWQKANGLADTGTMKAEDVVPAAWPARVGKVDIKVGDQLTSGGQVMALTAPAAAVSLDLDPGQRLRAAAGQRVEIQVTSTRARANGAISEVDASPTTTSSSGNQSGGGDGSGSGNQNNNNGSSTTTYRAAVALDAPLEVVDGTQLSAIVVVSEERDMLTVPVGAVTKDGTGQPVVRVVDQNGAVRQVTVELGTQSGAYVAVRKGLNGDEKIALGGAR